jgi:hypothetical protein
VGWITTLVGRRNFYPACSCTPGAASKSERTGRIAIAPNGTNGLASFLKIFERRVVKPQLPWALCDLRRCSRQLSQSSRGGRRTFGIDYLPLFTAECSRTRLRTLWRETEARLPGPAPQGWRACRVQASTRYA